MLQLDELCLARGAEPVSLQCQPGEVTVVLGRNLSGKSALCRMVAGLDAPAGGRILIDGQDQAGVPTRERSVAMVYQAFVNYPHWTVAQNIASPMVARGEPAGPVRAAVEEIAGVLGLGEFLERLPSALSGGQQQRLAIARALAKQARVLVMDEPLVNLDYKLRESLRDELTDLAERDNLVLLYTTSDPAEALGIADQLLLLADNGFVQAAAPMTVYREPVSPLAADLLSDPATNRLHWEGVQACVRPEHVHLDPVDGVEAELTVNDTQTSGSETLVFGAVDGAQWVVRLPGLKKLAVDEPVTVYVREGDLLRFRR